MNRRTSFRRGPVAISRKGKGFSLIEILVVLVILLIGILAILRLFPGGFLTIVRTGEMTAAQALVDQQSNNRRNQTFSVQGFGAALPDQNGNVYPINGIRPDDLGDFSTTDLSNLYTRYNITPLSGYSPYYFSNINKLRYVIGETAHIPLASPATATTAWAGGTLYTLQYGPVFNIFQSVGSGGFKDSISVYGNSLTPVQQDSTAVQGSDLAAALPDGSYYAIDYANNKIAFVPRATNGRPAPYRLFRISALTYRTDQNTGALITDRTSVKMNATITVADVPAGSLPVWQNLQLFDCAGNDITASAHIWPGTEQVSRQFRLVTSATGVKAGSFTDDPYEYFWLSPQEANTQYANLGTLVFNPLAHIINPGDTTGPTTDPADRLTLGSGNNLIVHIDYLTFDNHIIRDDRNVPGAFPYAVRLSLSYIATAGDLRSDQSTYNGVFTEAASGPTPDVIVYNMATGTIVSQITGPNSTGVVPASIDAKTGLLTLGDPTQNGADVVKAGLQSASLRVFYRTQKEYGMQVQQASAQYLPVADPSCLDYESFYIGGGASGGAANKLYFDVSQAGKTINIGEYYTGPTTSPTDRHTNETYQITDNPADFESIPGKGTYAWIKLSGNLSSAATGRAVNNVQGASLKSRVIWIGSTDVNKDANGNPVILKRWRKVDNDTVLQATNQ